MICSAALSSMAAERTRADFLKRAKRLFDETQATYRRDTNNVEAAWQFARATFDLANLATKSSERAQIAEQGIAVAREAVARASNSAPAHYYLGMNLAQLAQTKFLGALKIVNEMEKEFSIVRELDAKFDDAGADRNLGLLYRDAPAIGSIGSRPKAREHLQNAVKLAPDSPDNRLNLLETYLKWGEKESAGKELTALEEMWPRARARLTGEEWEASWPDWEARFKKAKGKLEASAAKQ
jgi:tetratricopeptide (TPR) repeat protein